MNAETLTSFVFTIFRILTFLLWLILPFAIFGVKPLLRSIYRELAELNQRGREQGN